MARMKKKIALATAFTALSTGVAVAATGDDEAVAVIEIDGYSQFTSENRTRLHASGHGDLRVVGTWDGVPVSANYHFCEFGGEQEFYQPIGGRFQLAYSCRGSNTGSLPNEISGVWDGWSSLDRARFVADIGPVGDDVEPGSQPLLLCEGAGLRVPDVALDGELHGMQFEASFECRLTTASGLPVPSS